MEFVKGHITLIVAGIMVWFGASELMGEEEAKADDRKKLTPIGPRYLAVRPVSQPVQQLMDPYRFVIQEESTPGPLDDDGEEMTNDPPHAQAAEEPTPEGALWPAVRSDQAGIQMASGEATAVATDPEKPTIVTAATSPPGPVKLWVEAVAAFGSGGSARVCGQTVNVGEVVPGVDDLAPPVLLEVEGILAHVRYRGKTYALSLDSEPVIVGGDPDADDEGSSLEDLW